MQRQTDDVKLNITNFNAFHKVLEVLDCFLLVFLSEQLLGDPLTGIALSILFSFLTTFFRMSLRGRIRCFRFSTKIVMLCLFGIVLGLCAISALFFSQIRWQAAILTLFAAFLTARTVCTDAFSCTAESAWNPRFLRLLLCHALFTGLFAAMVFTLLPSGQWIALVFEAAISCALLFGQVRRPRVFIRPVDPEALGKVYSYRLYRNMALYSSLAVYMSFLIYLFYMFSLSGGEDSVFWQVAVWFAVVLVATYLIYRILTGKEKTGLGVFIAGALIWLLSAYLLFWVRDDFSRGWWSLFWAGGSACMFAVTSAFQRRFKLVSPLIDFEISDDALMQNTVEMQNLAFMIAEVLVFGFILIVSWISPDLNEMWSTLAWSVLTLIPLLFVLVSIVMAARQPMEDKLKGRLEKVSSGRGSEELREKLDRTLVKEFRKKYGVRIIMFLLRPFLHHKVYGRHHVDEREPAIFVCNHGSIYGPMVSVIYLPFHFRPWVDDRMLDSEKIFEHMYNGTFVPKKWMPDFLKRFCTRISAKFCIWALNSFDPIPVYRNNLRKVIRTMEESVEALKADDNILLFPEKEFSTSGVGTEFYTGFAHIAVLYHRATGRAATFYPVFADKKRRTYSIGEGIRYRPETVPAEEKRRIAESLHEAMCRMQGEGED